VPSAAHAIQVLEALKQRVVANEQGEINFLLRLMDLNSFLQFKQESKHLAQIGPMKQRQLKKEPD
jgi:hypothetical protein